MINLQEPSNIDLESQMEKDANNRQENLKME